MHDTKLYGRFVEGASLTPDDASAVASYTKRLTNYKDAAGLNGLRWRRTLPSGRDVILKDEGGTFRVFVLERTEQRQDESYQADQSAVVPMLFSGVPTRTIIRPGEKVALTLTEACRARLQAHADDKAATPSTLMLERFAIPYADTFRELAPEMAGSGGLIYTQYHGQHPSWYSGAMQQVVQCVAGYGRQDMGEVLGEDKAELPQNRFEVAKMPLPPRVAEKVSAQLANTILPGYTGEPPADGQIRYDFRSFKTHGVCFAADGDPWLIRIAGGWVYAMPLPVVPATTTKAFAEYVQELGDGELQVLLDTFKGMPTGEDFPSKASVMQAWIKAGAIIKVCTTADFHLHYEMYSACGWALSDSGREGYNTCMEVRYTSEARGTGTIYAHAYKLTLQIGAKVFNGKLPPYFEEIDRSTKGRLSRYLADVYGALGDAMDEKDAIRFKIRRASASELMARIRMEWNAPGEVVYWRNQELAPIAPIYGNVARVASGPYIPSSNFKVPEPFEDGCIDIQPPISRRRLDGYPDRWETIFFGYYSGDSLKVVKQHADDQRSFKTAEQSNFEQCMIVGSWKKTEEVASSSLKGGMYSTDFDYRETLPNSTVTTTEIVGKDLGYDSIPRIFFPYPPWSGLTFGTVFRHRYYSTQTIVTTVNGGQSLAVGGCVPFLSRNALLFAHAKWDTGSTKVEESLQWSWVADPNSSEIHLRNMYTRWPVEYWITDISYGPTTCSDFADRGSWGPGKGEVTSWAQSILGGPTAQYGWAFGSMNGAYGGGSDPKIKPYSRAKITPPGDPYIGDVEWEQRGITTVSRKRSIENYLRQSPTPGIEGASFRQDATRNCVGHTTYEVTTEGDGRVGSSRFHGLRDMPFFIGVINE